MIDATERGCAHRPMSADGPRGECMSCLIDDRDHWRAAALAEGKAKLRNRAELRDQEHATQQLSAELSRLESELAKALDAYDAEVMAHRDEATRLLGELSALRASAASQG